MMCTVDTDGHNEGFFWPCHCIAVATTSAPDAFSGICQSCKWSSGEFSLLEFSIPLIPYAVCWCLLLIMRATVKALLALPLCHRNNHLHPRCLLRHMPTMPWVLPSCVSLSELSLQLIPCVMYLLSVFRFPCGYHAHQWGLNHLSLWCYNPMEYTRIRHICFLVIVCGPCQECIKWLLLPLF